jgi:hypothetical protein
MRRNINNIKIIQRDINMTNSMGTEEDDSYILMDDCCLKKTIQTYAKTIISKPLTEPEARMLCVYEFTLSTTTYVVIIQFQVVGHLLTSICVDVCPIHFIRLVALFINTMFIIHIIVNFKELLKTFLCECDYRQHPELDEE